MIEEKKHIIIATVHPRKLQAGRYTASSDLKLFYS
jgi:hypothetical protein